MSAQNHRIGTSPAIQTLMTGLEFGESARWHDGRFWFSDWGTHEIIAIDAGGSSELDARGRSELNPVGSSEVVLRLPFSSFPFCFDWLPDGRLLIASASNRPLLRREPDGSLVAHADLGGLAAKGWNEIVVDSRGNAYINGGFEFKPGEPYVPGIIAVVTPDGHARQVADGIAFPNGMAVTPDNSTLIIAESFGKRLTAFDIAEDGNLSNRRVWADLQDGSPDGICLDGENAVWYADVPNRRCVRVREGGEVLETIDMDRGCFSCALGGKDKRTLFIVAREWKGFAKMFDGSGTGLVVSIEVSVPGH
jgi:sugar lactone lactonase YvrE